MKYKFYKIMGTLHYKQKKNGKKRRCQILDFKNNLLKKFGIKLQLKFKDFGDNL